jgi:hypothetical protein
VLEREVDLGYGPAVRRAFLGLLFVLTLAGCGASDASSTQTGFNEASTRTWNRTGPGESTARTAPASLAAAEACRRAIRRQIAGDIRADRRKPFACRSLDRPTYERLFLETFADYRDKELTKLGFPKD